MELILGIGILALFGMKIIKAITSSIVFLLTMIISLVMTFVYDIPYVLSLGVCIVLKYGIKDFIRSISNLSKVLITSKYRYKYGYIQKLVNVLINCNYSVFIFLCYTILINELINQNLVINLNEVIAISIIVIISIRVLRMIVEKISRSILIE